MVATFHLWKFKMRMMLSKHGLWKSIDGNTTIPNDEDEMESHNKKARMAFALLCAHQWTTCTHSIF